MMASHDAPSGPVTLGDLMRDRARDRRLEGNKKGGEKSPGRGPSSNGTESRIGDHRRLPELVTSPKTGAGAVSGGPPRLFEGVYGQFKPPTLLIMNGPER